MSTRFADARSLNVYAGSAPITRASGMSLTVHHRKVKNQCLAAGYMWVFASPRMPGPRAHCDRRRSDGDRHSSALHNTFNRMLGCLDHRPQEREVYAEFAAFLPP
ncbi:hypothetical protein [Streptosporangium sp. NPDC000396]|uniref:hypothetical protein n=1 Tax=Streptosporangium sp. NPDC000396 TaxID=3366185 RepID=UPI003687CFCC